MGRCGPIVPHTQANEPGSFVRLHSTVVNFIQARLLDNRCFLSRDAPAGVEFSRRERQVNNVRASRTETPCKLAANRLVQFAASDHAVCC